MIRKITVHERATGKTLRVGELVSEIDELGRARCQFRYLEEFLVRRDAFAIDPVSLPLRSGIFTAERKVVFDVLEDSLPDEWGRKLLIRRHHLPRGEQNLASLLEALAASGLGALSFTSDATKRKGPSAQSGAEASLLEIDGLTEAIEHYERGDATDPMLSLLLSAGSSPGGARPKVLVSGKTMDEHYLAKIPSIKDTLDVVRVEGATMSLATKAGLNTADFRLIECADKSVLLMRRFDLMPDGCRRHMISFRSLLRADAYYVSRYDELHGVVRKYSAEPAKDAEQLFRQMVFNALVGNTDDHLKNFWMLYSHSEGWRLSPAFDLLPNIARRSEHALIFDTDPRNPGRSTLVKHGRTWGVSGCKAIVDEVYAAVESWKTEFSAAGVSDEDIGQLREIDGNVQR
jgi:serine/threonine-protein kinase HipA